MRLVQMSFKIEPKTSQSSSSENLSEGILKEPFWTYLDDSKRQEPQKVPQGSSTSKRVQLCQKVLWDKISLQKEIKIRFPLSSCPNMLYT